MKEEDIERVKNAINTLVEHFDAVQIFASRHEPETEDGTVHVNLGRGNWFARFGHVRTWLVKEEEFFRERQRRDDGEDDFS